MTFRFLVLFLLLSLRTFLLPAQKDITLKIIHTSDVHGAILPFDFINNNAVDFGLAHVYTYVKQERSNEEADSSHKCNFWLNNNLFITNIGFS